MNRRKFLAIGVAALPFLRERPIAAQVPGVEYNTPPQEAMRLYQPGQAHVLYGETAVKGNPPESVNALIQGNAGRPDTADDPDYAYSPPVLAISNHTDQSAGAVFGNEPDAQGDNFYVQNDSEEGGIGGNFRQGTPDHRQANGSAIQVQKWSDQGHAARFEAPAGTNASREALILIEDDAPGDSMEFRAGGRERVSIDAGLGQLEIDGFRLKVVNGRLRVLSSSGAILQSWG